MKIKILSRDGQVCEVAVDAVEWRNLSPCGKVLAIHAKGRHITKGQPFEVLSVRRVEAGSEAK